MQHSRVASTTFRTFWSGQALSQLGVAVGSIALPVLAVQTLHADEAQLGYLNAAGTLAFLLVGLPAGAWIDRWLKRPTMLAADLIRCVAALVVPLLWLTGHLAIWHLYVVALVIGLATVFFDVSYQSYIPILVPDEEIERANSHLEATAQVARLAGPALGGLVLRVLAAPLLMLADAIGYLSSAIALALVRDGERAERAEADPVERRPLWHEIGEGLGFVARNPAIRLITTSTLISNLTSTTAFTLTPILFLRRMGLDPFTLGVVMAAGAVGGLAGATLTPWLQRRYPARLLIPGGMLLAFLGALLTPLATLVSPRPLAVAVLIVGDFAMTVGVLVYNITQVSMRQRLCPRRLLGRMNASIRFVVWGCMPIASLLAGWLGSAIGTLPTVWLATLASGLAVIPLIMLQPHLRDTPEVSDAH